MSYSGSGGKYRVDDRGQGYDNRAYAGSRQSSSRYAEDPEYRRSSREKETSQRCIVIVAIIAFVILIAAAIAIGVYFGVTRDDDKDRPETAAASVPMTVSLDEPWNDNLYDPTSQVYQDKAAQIQTGMNNLMADAAEYIDSDVTGMSQGTITANLIMRVKATKITKSDGTRVDVTPANMVAIVNEKAAAKTATLPFAAKLVPSKTQALPVISGEVGNVDLGGTCSTGTDCRNHHVACPASTKKCACAAGYYNRNTNNNNGGVCLPGKAINEACPTGLDRECTFTSGKCMSGKCQCDTGKIWKNGACTDIVTQCMDVVWNNEDCSSIAELFSITDKLDTRNDKCVSVMLAKTEFLPACFARHAVSECTAIVDVVWANMVAQRESRYPAVSLSTMFIDDCRNVQPNICQAQTIATVFRCYSRFHDVVSACNINHCILYPSNNDGCSEQINVNEVMTKAVSIYEVLPECPFGECASNGFDYFKEACGAALGQDCNAFEAFIGCVSFNLVVHGLDKCDSQILANNLNAGAGILAGNICSTGTYAQLDAKIPGMKSGLCNAAFVHRSIYQYYCPADNNLFPGTSPRDNCLREIGRKVCLYTIFEQSKIKCEDDVIWATSELPAVANGVFTQTDCEDAYPCVMMGLSLSPYIAPTCVDGIIQFLELSGKDIDIDNALALDAESDTDYLKCRVLNRMTSCAYGVMLASSNTQCRDQAGLADITTALLIMANAGTANSPGAVQKVNIFEGCPAYVPSTSPCPTTDEVMYSILGPCPNHILNSKKEGESGEKVCEIFGGCAQTVMDGYTEAYKTFCPKLEEIYAPLSGIKQLQYYKDLLDVDCGLFDKCLEMAWMKPDCVASVGLFSITHQLETQNDKCVSSDLAATEFLPSCFERHKIPECVPMARAIWTKMIQTRDADTPTISLTSMFIDGCENFQADICQSQTIATLFRCFNRYNEGASSCNINHCIETPSNSDGCTGAIDVTAVKAKATDIYGGVPGCQFKPCAEDGWLYFSDPSVCGAALASQAGVDPCNGFEALIGCTSFNLVAQGLDKCDSQTLANNLNAGAPGGNAGSICSSGTYAQLDAKIPDKSGLCDAAFVHRSIYLYFCLDSPYMFTGTSPRDNCLKEVNRKVCLYTIFEGNQIKCDVDTILETSELASVTAGVFEYTNCEDAAEYGCIMLGLSLAPYLVPNCVNGIVQFLELSGKGVNIDTALARNPTSDTDYMKCRVLNAMMACAQGTLTEHAGSACTDQPGMAEVRTSLLMMANAATAMSAGSVKKVDIFEECPAFVPSTSNCPTTDHILYNVMGHCVNRAKEAQNEQTSMQVCKGLEECVEGVMHGFISVYKMFCADVETIVGQVHDRQYLDYLALRTGIDCHENEGECPDRDGQAGTCVEECSVDADCEDDEKCCSNGCGHTCVAPYVEWHPCGAGALLRATERCGTMLSDWEKDTGTCSDWEAFVGCAHYHYLTAGVEICGVATFVNNLKQQVITEGLGTPEVCNMTAFIAKLSTTKAGICTNPFVYNTILKYICVENEGTAIWDGTDPKQACLREIARVVCVGTIFGESGLTCGQDDYTSTKNMDDARAGVFSNNARCEETYPCMFELPTLMINPDDETAQNLGSCINAIVMFLGLATHGVPINTVPALGSSNQLLKCGVLDAMTQCVRDAHSDSCKANLGEIRTGLLFMAHQFQAGNPAATTTIQVFDSCPAPNAADFPSTGCPVNDMFINTVVAHSFSTAYQAFNATKAAGGSDQDANDAACSTILLYAQTIKGIWGVYCPTIDSHYNTLFEANSLTWLSDNFGWTCPVPSERK